MKTLLLPRDKSGVFRPGPKIDDDTKIKSNVINQFVLLLGLSLCAFQHETDTDNPINGTSWLATLLFFASLFFWPGRKTSYLSRKKNNAVINVYLLSKIINGFNFQLINI